jgi:hypothetical protein
VAVVPSHGIPVTLLTHWLLQAAAVARAMEVKVGWMHYLIQVLPDPGTEVLPLTMMVSQAAEAAGCPLVVEVIRVVVPFVMAMQLAGTMVRLMVVSAAAVLNQVTLMMQKAAAAAAVTRAGVLQELGPVGQTLTPEAMAAHPTTQVHTSIVLAVALPITVWWSSLLSKPQIRHRLT